MPAVRGGAGELWEGVMEGEMTETWPSQPTPQPACESGNKRKKLILPTSVRSQ